METVSEIETPRYDLFTRVLVEIASRGGIIQEIAGNDDIMITLSVPAGAEVPLQHGTVLHRMKRDGFPSDSADRGSEGAGAGGVPARSSPWRSRPRTRLRLLVAPFSTVAEAAVDGSYTRSIARTPSRSSVANSSRK
jgi:hypothetical protein